MQDTDTTMTPTIKAIKLMKANAKNLILELMLATGESMSARDGIIACSIFGITENSLRVALARLSAGGLIETAERGNYRLGGAAKDFAGEVATWRFAEQRLHAWQGGYVAVHAGALGRSDRVALRRDERALQMLGFREFERGLHIRPDNIDRDVAGVRQRLYRLGLTTDAAVFRAEAFDPAREARARRLWNGKALTESYGKLRAQLDAWVRQSPGLDLAIAARESFLLGGHAIRQIVFDPLLPEPLVDAAERQAFIQSVHRFDEAGRVIWGRFFASMAADVKVPLRRVK